MLYILIDNYNILIRYSTALLNETNLNMQRYGGLMRYFMLIAYLHRKYPEAIIVTFSDKCRNNFRKKIITDYKGTRKSLPNNILEQIKDIHMHLETNNITNIYHDEYEADDLISSFVKYHSNDEHLIISTDKDLLQIISNANIKIYNPFKRIYIDENYIIDTYSIESRYFALYQALIGDNSDNIRGIDGVGPKTAIKILNTTKNIHDIKKIFIKYNFEHLEIYLQLTTLFNDVDISKYVYIHQKYDLTDTINDLKNKCILL